MLRATMSTRLETPTPGPRVRQVASRARPAPGPLRPDLPEPPADGVFPAIPRSRSRTAR